MKKDMIISCNSCNTKFKIANKIVGENGRFVRCSRCEHEWLLLPEKEKMHYEDNPNVDKKIIPSKNTTKSQDQEINEMQSLASQLKFWFAGVLISLLVLFSLLILFEDSEIVTHYFSGPRKLVIAIKSFTSQYRDDAQAHLALENVMIIDAQINDKSSDENNNITEQNTQDDAKAIYTFDILQFFITNSSDKKIETISRITVICYTMENKIVFQDILITNKIIYPGKRVIFTINLNNKFNHQIQKVKIYANDKLIGTEMLTGNNITQH